MSLTQLEYETDEVQVTTHGHSDEEFLNAIFSVVLYTDEELIRESVLEFARDANYRALHEMITRPGPSSVIDEKISDRYIEMCYDERGEALSESQKIKGRTKYKASLIELAQQKKRMHEIKAKFRNAVEKHDRKEQEYLSYKSNRARVPSMRSLDNEEEQKIFSDVIREDNDVIITVRMNHKQTSTDRTTLKLVASSKIGQDVPYALTEHIPNPKLLINIRKIAYDALGPHSKDKLRQMKVDETTFLEELRKVTRIVMHDTSIITSSGDMIISGKFPLSVDGRVIDVVAKLTQVSTNKQSAELSFVITTIEITRSSAQIIATNFPWMPIASLLDLRRTLSNEAKNHYFSQVVLIPLSSSVETVDEELMSIVHDTEPWSMLKYSTMRKWMDNKIGKRVIDEFLQLQSESATFITIFRGSLEFRDVAKLINSNYSLVIALCDCLDKLMIKIVRRRGNVKESDMTDYIIMNRINTLLRENIGISVQEAETVRMMRGGGGGRYRTYESMVPKENVIELTQYKTRAMLALLTRVCSLSLSMVSDRPRLFDYISGSDLQLTSLPYCITERNIFIYQVGPEIMTLLIDYKTDDAILNKVKSSILTNKSKVIRPGSAGYDRVASFKASLIIIDDDEEKRKKHKYTILINNVEVALTEIIINGVLAIEETVSAKVGQFVIWHPKFTILFLKHASEDRRRCEVYIIPSTRASRIQKPLHNWPVYAVKTGELYPSNLYTGGVGYMVSWI